MCANPNVSPSPKPDGSGRPTRSVRPSGPTASDQFRAKVQVDNTRSHRIKVLRAKAERQELRPFGKFNDQISFVYERRLSTISNLPTASRRRSRVPLCATGRVFRPAVSSPVAASRTSPTIKSDCVRLNPTEYDPSRTRTRTILIRPTSARQGTRTIGGSVRNCNGGSSPLT